MPENHMPAQVLHRGDEMSADATPRLTVMALHMCDQRFASSVSDTTDWTLLSDALLCGHERDGE